MAETVNADITRPYRRIVSVIELFSHFGADSVAMTTARVYLTPIQIPVKMVVDRIAVQWASVAAGNVRACIYRDNGDTPAGGALIVESASVAKSGTNRRQEITIADTTLLPGLYWIGIQSSENTTSYMRCDGAWGVASGTLNQCYYTLGGYGAHTNPCPAITVSTEPVSVYLRVRRVCT